jgi:hypothetical protein
MSVALANVPEANEFKENVAVISDLRQPERVKEHPARRPANDGDRHF